MNILLFLIPISIVLLLIGIAAFFWAVRRDQFENLDAAALDVLADDSSPEPDKPRDAG
jgi:cbb3-type cytochrome oxidase maturation protein